MKLQHRGAPSGQTLRSVVVPEARAQTSRRQFLRVAGGLAAILPFAGLLGACGSGVASVSNAPSPSGSLGNGSGSIAAKPVSQAPASAAAFTLGWVTRAAVSAPLWMAEAVHAFTDEKVTINSKFTQAAVAIPALIARELDGVIVSGAPIITADLNGNEDLVFVGSLLNHPTGALYSAPSIRTAADLRGKIVSSDRPGTPEEYSMQRALALLGLKSNDVNLLSLGSVANYVALTTGQVQAAILGNPDSFRALANGYIKLQDLSRESYQNVGVVVSRARIPGLPQLAGLLAGLRQGIVAYNSQRDLALQVLKQNTSEEDPGILDQTYELFHSVLPFDPTLKPTMEGLQAMIDFLAGTISAAKSAKAEQFVDLRFLS